MSATKKILKKKSRILNQENLTVIEGSSSDSSAHGTICYGMVPQELGRPRLKTQKSSMNRITFVEASDALSNTSLSSSITRFRSDFETFKCKMRVFGESLNLCRCISDDYRSKLDKMEKRLISLERRQKLFKINKVVKQGNLLSLKLFTAVLEEVFRTLATLPGLRKSSNYSVIIQKNKLLAHKSKKDIEPLSPSPYLTEGGNPTPDATASSNI